MNAFRLRSSITAVILAVLVPAAFGACGKSDEAPRGAVTGVVRDRSTGAPIAGVAVGDGAGATTTDAAGAYTLVTTAGRHTLAAGADGYVTTWRVADVSAATPTVLNWSLLTGYDNQAIPAETMEYTILAWNDLGMHCAQDDYSYFCILPPFNTVHVQVIRRGAGVVTSGIKVLYAFPNKTNSAAHTNFWTYAPRYGWNVPPNVGITGTPLAGEMAVDDANLGFVAVGIPVTPYDDNGAWDPYGTAVITVTDNVGTVLQTAEVVVPVSTELNCSDCHLDNAFLNIMQTHDRITGTTLVADRAAGTLHKCAECHADNALGAPGKPGVKNLSLAMHGWHKPFMPLSDPLMDGCYHCHPGPQTQCLRGVMASAGLVCKDCHGTMAQMADSLAAGRRPWLDEPKCGDCHGEKYAENNDTLFRNSVFTNSPDPLMNGKLYCEACHGSTHGEYGSTSAKDHTISRKFQGDDRWIWNCFVCHTDAMTSPSIHM